MAWLFQQHLHHYLMPESLSVMKSAAQRFVLHWIESDRSVSGSQIQQVTWLMSVLLLCRPRRARKPLSLLDLNV